MSNPDRPEIPQSLGYLAWQEFDTDLARKEFKKAFAAGSKDPQMCFHLAMLELQHGDIETTAIPALRRALEGKPDYHDARFELGIAELRANHYAESIADLKLLKTVKPDNAGRYFNALAYSYAHTGNLSEARKQAESAKKWDRTDPDKEQTANLLRYLEEQERAKPVAASEGARDAGRPRLAMASKGNPFVKAGEKVVRVEGTAKEVGCDGGLQFTIVSGGTAMTFAVSNPNLILIKHNSDTTFDFQCGPQKEFPIAVEYVPAERRGKIAGYVRMLEF